MSENKLETKVVIESLGYKEEDFKSPQEFIDRVSADFVRRSNILNDDEVVNTVVGAKMKRIETALVRGAKEFGIEVKDDDFKDVKHTDQKVEIVLGKLGEFHKGEVGNFKKLAESKGTEAVKEWQDKYGMLEKKYSSIEEMNKTLAGQIEEKEKWANETVKTFKMNDLKAKAEEKIRGVWKENPSEFEIIGFKTKMAEKYDVDVDDKEGLIVFEKASKKRIANPSVVNAFMTYDEVMAMELKANNLDRKNPNNDKKQIQNPFDHSKNGSENKGKLPVSPNFMNKG